MKSKKYQVVFGGLPVAERRTFNSAANAILDVLKIRAAETGETFRLIDSGIVKDQYLNAISGHRTWASNKEQLKFFILRLED